MTATQVQSEADPEALPYNISFARYNQAQCQITGMDGKNAKAALMILRDVGIYFTSSENFSMNSGMAEIKLVFNSGDYSALYHGCHQDEEIKEIKLSKKEKGIDIRVFYFTIESKKMFYVVAAKHTHIDTEKGNKNNKVQARKKAYFGKNTHKAQRGWKK